MSPRETSGITTGLILLYVRDHGGDRAVQQVLHLAALPHAEADLWDESHWISYQERIRLFEAAVQVFDDPWCTYEMGAKALRWRLNPSSLVLLQALGSPQRVYQQVARAIPKFTTTSTMRLLACRSTQAELSFRLHDGYEHSRLDCLYAQGLLSAGPELFNLPPAQVEHPSCQGEGAEACTYRVRWVQRPPAAPRRRDPHDGAQALRTRGEEARAGPGRRPAAGAAGPAGGAAGGRHGLGGQ